MPNIRVIAADQDLENYLGEHRDEFLATFANDLQPLRTAMEYALRGVPYGPDFSARLTMLKTELPAILKKINQAPKTAGMLSEIIANAIRHGLEARQGSNIWQRATGRLSESARRGTIAQIGDERTSEDIIAEHPATGGRTVFNKAAGDDQTEPKLSTNWHICNPRGRGAAVTINAGEMDSRTKLTGRDVTRCAARRNQLNR